MSWACGRVAVIVLGVRQGFWKYLELGIKKSIWGEPYNLIWVNLSAHIKQLGIMMTAPAGREKVGRIPGFQFLPSLFRHECDDYLF